MSQPRPFRRQHTVARRVAAPADGLPSLCFIPGCGRPTQRAAGNGLAPHHCKHHVEHRARHGSHWHGTYRAAERRPYERAAAQWIAANHGNLLVATAARGLDEAMRSAGTVVPAGSLRGLPPDRRARIALARLREADVGSGRLLAIGLGMAALIEEDLGSHRIEEFRIVQIAKAAHRLASGDHRRWDFPLPGGTTTPYQLHAFARSTGGVLRHLGRMIDEACWPGGGAPR